MCKVYGYCRISTAKQNIERQVRNIQAVFPNADIRKEVYTGTKYQGREELKKILGKVQEGDMIVFDSVSRMSRNAEDGTKLYFELYHKGINLVFLKERHIDTDAYKEALKSTELVVESDGTTESTLVSEILQAIIKFMIAKASADITKAFEQSEKEVTDLQERTKEGLETARRNGTKTGNGLCGAANRGKTYTSKKEVEAKEKIRKFSKSFGGNMSNKELMDYCRITEPTLLKYKKKIREEMIKEGKIE